MGVVDTRVAGGVTAKQGVRDGAEAGDHPDDDGGHLPCRDEAPRWPGCSSDTPVVGVDNESADDSAEVAAVCGGGRQRAPTRRGRRADRLAAAQPSSIAVLDVGSSLDSCAVGCVTAAPTVTALGQGSHHGVRSVGP